MRALFFSVLLAAAAAVAGVQAFAPVAAALPSVPSTSRIKLAVPRYSGSSSTSEAGDGVSAYSSQEQRFQAVAGELQ
jgi:hypothetical protein